MTELTSSVRTARGREESCNEGIKHQEVARTAMTMVQQMTEVEEADEQSQQATPARAPLYPLPLSSLSKWHRAQQIPPSQGRRLEQVELVPARSPRRAGYLERSRTRQS
jgi:hypothetical protein